MLKLDRTKLQQHGPRILDRNTMTWLSPNTPAPFAMLRGGNCGLKAYNTGSEWNRRGLSGLGQAEAVQQGANQFFAFLTSIGSGRKEANTIVQLTNSITSNVLAPIGDAMQHPEDYSTAELQAMWDALMAAEDRYMDFLHNTNWSDGRAAAQAERDWFASNSVASIQKKQIQTALANSGGYVPSVTTYGGGVLPSPIQTGAISPTVQRVAKDAQAYLPWILGAVFLFMVSNTLNKKGS